MDSKKILIAEDSETIRQIVRIFLEDAGYEVVAASDGMEALNKARSEVPDLLILDLMMPKMDGFKVCRMLKFDQKHRSTPIIMLTARSGQNDRAMGEEVGVDEYLVKPFDPDVLLERVAELLADSPAPVPPDE